VKLTIFGATGGTGRQLVRQALAAGHEVTAVVRGEATGLGTDPHLTVVRANVMDPSAVESAIVGRDVVISAIGPRDLKPTTVCTDSARSIITAMRAVGVRRFIVVSANGPFSEGDGFFTKVLIKPIVQWILRHPFADVVRMESQVRDSGLEWTILRPPRLTNGALTGHYRRAFNRNVRGGFSISRADLAHCALECLNDPDSIGVAVGIGY